MTAHVSHWTLRHAILDRMVTQFGFVLIEDDVDDQPALVKAVILHACLEIAPDNRARAIAANDIFRCDPFDLAPVHVLETQLDSVAFVLDVEHIGPRAHADGLHVRESCAQQLFEVGLMKAIIRTPALRTDALGTKSADQREGESS